MIDGWGISCEIALISMSLDLTDDQSTLVQVMAWCRQATSHYLSQCWPRSLSPYGITRPEWVKSLYEVSSSPGNCIHIHILPEEMCVQNASWCQVMPYGITDLGQHWIRKWLAAWGHQAITWTKVLWQKPEASPLWGREIYPAYIDLFNQPTNQPTRHLNKKWSHYQWLICVSNVHQIISARDQWVSD